LGAIGLGCFLQFIIVQRRRSFRGCEGRLTDQPCHGFRHVGRDVARCRRPLLSRTSLSSLGVRASEVERHPGGRSLDCRAADRVVVGVATTDLVAVTAGPETIMRARTLSKI
jgi:hypothetical protein